MSPRHVPDVHAAALEQVRLHIGEVQQHGRFDRQAAAAPVAVAVHEFELTAVTPRHRLLRLAIDIYSPPLPELHEVRLRVGEAAIAPLPDPAAEVLPPGQIRAGFPVPAWRFGDGRGPFELVLGDGRRVRLSAPVERPATSDGRRFSRRVV